MNKRIVLHIFKGYFPHSIGGVEDVIRAISDTTSSDFQNLLLTFGDRNYTKKIGNLEVTFIKQKFNFKNNPLSLSFLLKFKKLSAGADLIHIHYPCLLNELIFYSVGFNRPYVVTFHANVVRHPVISWIYKELSRPLLKKAQRVIFTTEIYQELNRSLVDREHGTVVPITVSELEADVRLKRPKRMDASDEPFILFLGAIRKYKGIHLLIEAQRETGLRVIIAGASGTDRRSSKLLKGKLNKKLEYVGPVSDGEKAWLLKACRFLVLPSINQAEAFGIVLLEAHLFGKATLTSNYKSGFSEVNKNRITGLHFENLNSMDLADKMRQMFREKTKTEIFGQKAYEIVTKNYRSEKNVEYTKIYSEILRN